MEAGAKEPKYTPEQLKEMSKARTNYYKEGITELRAQEVFEKLQADIEEHKTRRIIAIAKRAQLFAQEEADAEEEQETAEEESELNVKANG